MKLQAEGRPGLAGLTGAWSFIGEVRRWTELDNQLRPVLKHRRMRTAPNQEKLRRTLARQRAQVQAHLAANWLQVQTLADQIEAATATDRSHHRQLAKLDDLRRDATRLAELGAALDRQVSELASVDHRTPGMRWRPTAAAPF
jgi:prophage DNA circulation protein